MQYCLFFRTLVWKSRREPLNTNLKVNVLYREIVRSCSGNALVSLNWNEIWKCMDFWIFSHISTSLYKGEVHWTDGTLPSLLEVWRHVVTWPGRENPRDFWDPSLVSDTILWISKHLFLVKTSHTWCVHRNVRHLTRSRSFWPLFYEMFLMKDSVNREISKSAHIWLVWFHPCS